MATGDKFVNIVNKRLMGVESFKDYFLDYLKQKVAEQFFARVYDKDGTFRDTAIAIASSANDTIDLNTSPNPEVYGTDGSGHLLLLPSLEGPGGDVYNDVPFENQTGYDYDVGLHYAEIPSGVHVNPRTGKPEYMRWEEKIGVADEPVSISDQGGGVYRFRLPTSMCPGDRTCVGRGFCWLWKKVPGDAALTEAIAIVSFTVGYSTYNYIDVDTGTYDLGQETFSEDETAYMLLLEGPTIARTGDLDIEAADDYWYIGEVTGNGPGATPSVFDTGDQRLITKSLSDLIPNLVYDNIINTFTRSQHFLPSVDEVAAHFRRDYSGDVVTVQNDGLGDALVAQTAATSADDSALKGIGTVGLGIIAQGKPASPVRGSLKMVPQNARPSGPSTGELWVYSEEELGIYLESFRVITQEKQERTFLYPIACGMPENANDLDAWVYSLSSNDHFWTSKNPSGSGVFLLGFDLNRFIPQGATIRRIRAWVDPGENASGTDRMSLSLLKVDNQGGSWTAVATEYFQSTTDHNPAWIDTDNTAELGEVVNSDSTQYFIRVKSTDDANSTDKIYSLEVTYEEGDQMRLP